MKKEIKSEHIIYGMIFIALVFIFIGWLDKSSENSGDICSSGSTEYNIQQSCGYDDTISFKVDLTDMYLKGVRYPSVTPDTCLAKFDELFGKFPDMCILSQASSSPNIEGITSINCKCWKK